VEAKRAVPAEAFAPLAALAASSAGGGADSLEIVVEDETGCEVGTGAAGGGIDVDKVDAALPDDRRIPPYNPPALLDIVVNGEKRV
jgi:hypothetical protein